MKLRSYKIDMTPLESRYARQILLPDLGEEGQQRIRNTKVLIVGVGGLGCPIASYLVGAGIGTIGLMDDDVVSLTNLHRQVLFTEKEVGNPKSSAAKKRLSELNRETAIIDYNFRLTAENAREIISQYDIVVDGCDNFSTRYVIDEVCRELHKPYVYGSIQGLSGQVSVFCTGENPKYYRDLFPEQETSHCEYSKAVLPTTPAVVGSVEANQVLLLAANIGKPLIGKLWTIELDSMESFIIDL
jgi:adenylyltransferase/sulfurtransferase